MPVYQNQHLSSDRKPRTAPQPPVSSLANPHPHPRSDQSEQEAEILAQEMAVASWDFSKIRVFPPGRTDQPQSLFPLAAPPLAAACPPKIAIGRVDDPSESEADRIAHQVMRLPNSASATPAVSPQFGRGGPPGKEEARRLPARQAEASRAATSAAPSIVPEVLRSPGQPLDPGTRAFFEPRFGQSFSHVRVHADDRAAVSADAIGALSYTVGERIVFGAGRFVPHSTDGRVLLAHELAHVVQQTRGTAPLRVARQPSDDPRHQRGYSGEQDTGHQIYRAEDGWIVIEGPSGSSSEGHSTTGSGFDVVAYNTRTDQLDIVDNKSNKTPGNVSGATAIDPAQNLSQNLQGLIGRLTARQDVQARIRVLELLRRTQTALASGAPIPRKVHLVVTGLGGQKTGVSGPLHARGVDFKAPIAAEVRAALAKIQDLRDFLGNVLELDSREHKAQLDLIDKPSFSGFAGYWTHKIHNTQPPPTAIWNNAFGALYRTDGALRRLDVKEAVIDIVRARQAYLKALHQYLTWKNGTEGAATAMQKTIGKVAVGTVLAFVGASLALNAIFPPAAAGGTAAAQVALQGLRVAIANFDVAIAEEEFAMAVDEVEQALEVMQAL
jgi:hypothetical protein